MFSLFLNLTLHDYGKRVFCYFDKEDFGEGFLKVSDNTAWCIFCTCKHTADAR